ncbi:bifunctional glutamate--cysteine ligase GshA/glutathione synthetase GshB [Histophilus somni]|uniref:bifunctional glutamate--cysteine ligase GshA/glutathione synthetase GshB n=1 Tax=Histophilus somni TaxID=731 RepID=UPI00094B3690|nr:bifunctional glutamate--cysteine ligase GshA/glutathione synthetase GshB [Histophilus somni]
MKIQHLIKQHQLGLLFQQGSFGLEKESQRVYQDGSVVTTEHPKCFGNRSYHPYIQTDFAESQLELITPPNKNLEDSLRWLSAIHEVVLRSLPEDEFIFPLSMPAGLPSDELIKVAQLDNPEDVAYREHLVQSYGKNKQMVSGIHYNFQLDPALIQTLFNLQQEQKSAVDFQNNLYLKMAKNFLRYQWVLLYLLSATPTVESNYFKGSSPLGKGEYVRSLRSSKYGYVNDPEVIVSFDSLEQYAESLEHWVKSGKLIAEKEFYSNVRLRGAKKARDLIQNGIKYLEFRLFDLNPFEQYGMSLADARFIHHFVLLMIWLDEMPDQQGVELGRSRLAEVALENPLAQTAYREEGEWLLNQLISMLQSIGADQSAVSFVREKLAQFADGNMTSKDSYISPLIMENKVVTKKVLEKAGFNVPQSQEFTSVKQAIAGYSLFEKRAVVIKPKSTNYGLGITIFQQGVNNREDFAKAVEIAFREDKEIMVEDYLVGTEYRFFVLGEETLAVLLRVPANVVGDGIHTVAELVAQKNAHSLRGDGSRTPLKKIALGDIEQLQLKEQGLTVESIPAKDQIVQLRANSNISTGGDSIDITDEMHLSYKQLAVGIAKAMGAAVCGVDLIISDLKEPAQPDLSSWGVIEANFNPMMMMHIFPYAGQSRRLTRNVINMLFPEVK